MKSIIAANVVDLPEPVGPVTSTKPRGNMEMSRNTWPIPRVSIDSTSEGIVLKNRTRATVLIESVDAKACDTRYFEGKVRLKKFFKVLSLTVVHDVVDQRLHFGVILSGHIDAANVAVHSDHRWQACRKMEV
jgi:hypothetical protein